MANAPEIRKQLARFLSEQISLDEFEQWFAPYSWNIHKGGDAESQRLAFAIEHKLSQFEDDCDDLRVELARIEGASIGETRFGPSVSPFACLVGKSRL
jgi:hypothetical protein